MVAVGRIACCVPFCRRWRRGDPRSEWICWDHWKRIPLKRRRAYFRAQVERCPDTMARERGKIPRWMQQRPARTLGSGHYIRPRSIRAIWRLWDRLKRDAIERAL